MRFFYKRLMHMVDRVHAGSLNVPERIARNPYRTLDKANQRRIGPQMYHRRKDREIVPPLQILCADQHSRFVAGDTVDQIGPVKTGKRSEVG